MNPRIGRPDSRGFTNFGSALDRARQETRAMIRESPPARLAKPRRVAPDVPGPRLANPRKSCDNPGPGPAPVLEMMVRTGFRQPGGGKPSGKQGGWSRRANGVSPTLGRPWSEGPWTGRSAVSCSGDGRRGADAESAPFQIAFKPAPGPSWSLIVELRLIAASPVSGEGGSRSSPTAWRPSSSLQLVGLRRTSPRPPQRARKCKT